jgi:hypothetical protein
MHPPRRYERPLQMTQLTTCDQPVMCVGLLMRAAALAAALLLGATGAHAFDDAQYPNLKGQWRRISPPGQPAFDPSKPRGYGQEAPLTPEYQAVFAANIADMAAGGEGAWPGFTCRPPGMPPMMTAYEPMEIVVTPETTYIMIDHIHDTHRRVFTDGRDWPAEIEPSFAGYSIGRWIDEDGDGRYDVLEAETRAIKGPRAYDASGLPFHSDNETVVAERIYLDKADANVLHDQITVVDHALTRPWTVLKSYSRSLEPRPYWREYICAERNEHVRIGNENYFLSADGFLMPSKKDQPPPDLRFFKPGGK